MRTKVLALGLIAVLTVGCSEEQSITAVDDATQATPTPEFPAAQAARFNPRHYWSTRGNATTEPPHFFLGTTDAEPLVFKTDGAEAMRVTETGWVGIGTTSPEGGLHVAIPGLFNVPQLVVESTGGDPFSRLRFRSLGGAFWDVAAQPNILNFFSSGPAQNIMSLTYAGNVGIGTTSPGHPLEMASGAHVTTGGVWTDASSRSLKENIRELTTAEASAALNGLTPVRFNYKNDAEEDYVGFIAEDVPSLVAMQDRQGLSPMDVVAVLTKIVQEQGEKIAELEARLDSQQ